MQQSKWEQERYNQGESTPSFKERLLNTPLRYVGALSLGILILFGLWRVTEPVSDNRPLGTIPIIKPPKEPAKVRPKDIFKDTHQDKTIYRKLSGKEEPEKVEHLLGGPEEPIARPLSLPDDFIGEFLEEKSNSSILESSQMSQGSHQTNRQKVLEAEISEEEAPDETKPAEVAISGPQVKLSPQNAAVLQEMYCLQLGTLKTEEQAKLEWKRLSSRHALKPYFEKLKPEFKKVDLGNDMGVRVRLIAGLLSKKEARNLCQNLIKASKEHKIKLECQIKKR